MEIRPACLDDIPALVELFVAVVDERTWLGTEPGFDRERSGTRYAERIASADNLVLVAQAGDAIVGTLQLALKEGLHHLGMMIAHGYRAQGIGTELLLAALAWAREHASAGIALGVFPHNAGALRLYEKTGFRIVRRSEAACTRQTGEVWDLIEMEHRF